MSIQKWCRAAALLTAATLLMGCSQTAQNTTPPKDALFCKSVSDNVQTVAQLHVTPEPSKQPTASRTICNYAKQTAMWFPVMDYSNTLTNQSEAEFTASMRAEFQNAANMGINTVYVHVRAYQDAYYRSKLFPLGSHCSDSCTYDPLAIMTDLAHEQNLSFMPGSIRCVGKQTKKCSKWRIATFSSNGTWTTPNEAPIWCKCKIVGG